MKQTTLFTEKDRVITCFHIGLPPRETVKLVDTTLNYVREIYNDQHRYLEKKN